MRAAFSKRRKTLANALRGADLAPAAGMAAGRSSFCCDGSGSIRARAPRASLPRACSRSRARSPAGSGGGAGARAVELSELLERLAELAREAGLEVRELRAGADGEPPIGQRRVSRARRDLGAAGGRRMASSSASKCWLRALKTHAGAILEGRYLPPAVRERLSREPELG